VARSRTAVAALVLACAAVVYLSSPSTGSPLRPGSRHGTSPSARSEAIPSPPAPNAGVVGIALSGLGTHLLPPTSPSAKPYTANCHRLLDPAFTGKCVVARSASGAVAGVVEIERGAFGGQERDLVWRRQGRHWDLALVHVFDNPGLPTRLWRYDLRSGRPELVFVMPTALAGLGSELDVVEGNGRVSLYRYLGEGFAAVPEPGRLVTYVPGATEARPADNYFDQTLIGWLGGSWRVVSQQYVPYPAAMVQHRGAFWATGAMAAS
jgi:hypothetical protein